MTPGCIFLATLAEMARLADALPGDAEVSVSWADASPDLLLALVQQDGAELHTIDGVDEVLWARGNLVVRALRPVETRVRGPKLTVVR